MRGREQRAEVVGEGELGVGDEGEDVEQDGRRRERAGALLRELGEVIGVDARTGAPRQRRRDAGQIRLSWRDLRVLRFVGEQYAVTQGQLERLLALYGEDSERGQVVPRVAQRARLRWARAGLVESRQILKSEPPIVWLTARGRQLVELDVKSWRPSMNTIRHVPAVAEVRLFMERRAPEGRWVSERLLGRDQEEGRRGVSAGQRPDAEFHYLDDGGDSHVLAIEVELSQKGEGRLRAIVRDRLERYDGVWYFAPADPPSLRELVKRVSESLYRERLGRAEELRAGPGAGGGRQARRIADLEERDVVLRSLDGEKLWSALVAAA